MFVATWAEALPLLGFHPRVTGMGRRAYDLSDCEAVVSAGFAGACQPHLRPGSLVTGRLHTLDHVATPSEKAALGAEGVTAVDMETAWLKAAAADASRPFRSVRVIIDGVHDRAFSPATALHYPIAALSLWRAVRQALVDWQ